jgi:hypothetical protein
LVLTAGKYVECGCSPHLRNAPEDETQSVEYYSKKEMLFQVKNVTAC